MQGERTLDLLQLGVEGTLGLFLGDGGVVLNIVYDLDRLGGLYTLKLSSFPLNLTLSVSMNPLRNALMPSLTFIGIVTTP